MFSIFYGATSPPIQENVRSKVTWEALVKLLLFTQWSRAKAWKTFFKLSGAGCLGIPRFSHFLNQVSRFHKRKNYFPYFRFWERVWRLWPDHNQTKARHWIFRWEMFVVIDLKTSSALSTIG